MMSGENNTKIKDKHAKIDTQLHKRNKTENKVKKEKKKTEHYGPVKQKQKNGKTQKC